MTMLRIPVAAIAAAVAILLSGTAHAAVDWSKVPGKDITLLYPGQMSWEMLLTNKEHSGGAKFLAGKNCRECHEGEEQNSGKLMVADKSLEPTPIAGKPGSQTAKVSAALDGDTLHIRIAFAPGTQPDAGMEPKFSTKVAVMLDDGTVAEATRGGCWGACHDDLAKMPSGGAGDTTKYLARTRVKMARTGGAELKPAEEIAKMRDGGQFLEYWQARLNQGAAPDVVDGTVLEKRQENAAAAVTATAAFENGTWVVDFARKLNAGANHKVLAPGKTYTVGFSIHAGHTARRFHYVSLEKTLAIESGTADLVAKRN